jgi:hypothetical protein
MSYSIDWTIYPVDFFDDYDVEETRERRNNFSNCRTVEDVGKD